MSDTLIVYYSRFGRTKKVAEVLKKKLNCDIIELKEKNPKKYSFFSIIMSVMMGKKPKIENMPDISKYKNIFIGTPVYAGNLSAVANSFSAENNFTGKNVYIFGSSMETKSVCTQKIKDKYFGPSFKGEFFINITKQNSNLDENTKKEFLTNGKFEISDAEIFEQIDKFLSEIKI